MRCDKCGSLDLRVSDSRPVQLDAIHTMRRRRRCNGCDHRWFTYELPEAVVRLLDQRAASVAEPRRAAIRQCIAALEVMLK